MKKATEIAEEYKQYAYSVSHDLSAPVRAMVEFSKLLASENADAFTEDGREYLGLIVENGRKLQGMMDGMLQFSRLNTLASSFCDVDMGQVIDGCMRDMERAIGSTGAVITTGEMPVVWGDAQQLWLVMYHLLSNALLYQPAQQVPAVAISAVERGNFWRIEVRDNGIGIAEKMREAVFVPFRRLHSDEEYEGAGMGLTLARKIVERHGGSIGCEPGGPCGAIFYFTLPTERETV